MKITLRLLLICSMLLSGIAFSGDNAQFSKKEVKKFAKYFKENQKGKIFKKLDRVAPIGLNLHFRTQAQVTKETSSKADIITKFNAIAILEGVDDSVFQEITDEYQKMIFKRFKDLGMEIVSYDEMYSTKSYAKFAEGSEGAISGVSVPKKNWGVEKLFIPKDQRTSIWSRNFSPFGAHAKLPKELDAILYRDYVRIDFANIGVDVSSSTRRYSTRSVVTAGADTSVTAVVSIADSSLSVATTKKGAHLLDVWDAKAREKLNLYSPIEYAASAKECAGDCELQYKQGGFIQNTNAQTVKITADPVKYKEAVLQVLEVYLDKKFAIYQQVRGK